MRIHTCFVHNMKKINLHRGVYYLDILKKCSNATFLNNYSLCGEIVDSKIREVGLGIVGHSHKDFDKGFTAVWLLKESHISIHTWPEYNLADIDIYICNFSADNSEKAKSIYFFLKKLFGANKSELKIIYT
jgi:S-adenosylmethionine decarboxylase